MLSTLMATTMMAFAVTSQEAAPQAALAPQDFLAPQDSLAPVVASAGSVQPIDPVVWVTPGARIPDVELPRVDGKGLVRLSDYEGKRLLLIQFASW